MFLAQLTTNVLLFILGLVGIVMNRRNILIILMSVELVLLSLNLNFIIFSVYFDDLYGQLFSLFILTVAAAESAVRPRMLDRRWNWRGSDRLREPLIGKIHGWSSTDTCRGCIG